MSKWEMVRYCKGSTVLRYRYQVWIRTGWSLGEPKKRVRRLGHWHGYRFCTIHFGFSEQILNIFALRWQQLCMLRQIVMSRDMSCPLGVPKRDRDQGCPYPTLNILSVIYAGQSPRRACISQALTLPSKARAGSRPRKEKKCYYILHYYQVSSINRALSCLT